MDKLGHALLRGLTPQDKSAVMDMATSMRQIAVIHAMAVHPEDVRAGSKLMLRSALVNVASFIWANHESGHVDRNAVVEEIVAMLRDAVAEMPLVKPKGNG